MSYFDETPNPEQTGYLFLGASDEPARRREAEWQRLQRTPLAKSTMPKEGESRLMRYLDDLARVTGNSASFGIGDHLEGLANSAIHDAPTNDSLMLSQIRTEMARNRLGPWVGRGADLAGGLAGYAATLPMLPARLASLAGSRYLPAWMGRAVAPAALPLEATRGYLTSPGSPTERLHGAIRGALGDPTAMFNPMRGRTLAASTFGEPAMEQAGLGDYSPSGYMSRLLSSAGVSGGQ